jgi:hypothetical protein
VYFGDPASSPNGAGQLVVTPVTTGGVYVFDVLARNDGNQNLTHAELGFGSGAAAWSDAPGGSPSLPGVGDGAKILSVTVSGGTCAPSTLSDFGYTCALGSLSSGKAVTATFVVEAPDSPLESFVWASFKVAENVPDQGANRNTFFASSALSVGPTNSNGISTYLPTGSPLALSTDGQPPVPGDPQRTSVRVPGGFGGLVSLVETDGPTGCSPACIGQTVSANVRGGDLLTPYLQWTLVIAASDQVASKGGVYHTLDDGTVVDIRNSKANECSASKPVDCIEQYLIDKKAGITTIIFRTETNGAVRAN